jgi:hypothetical protein
MRALYFISFRMIGLEWNGMEWNDGGAEIGVLYLASFCLGWIITQTAKSVVSAEETRRQNPSLPPSRVCVGGSTVYSSLER